MSMLRLSLEQQRRLEALRLTQDLQRVATLLSQAFPKVAARLGDQLPALVAHAWPRAQALGLQHGLCLARYLSAWFMFGVEFEQQTGFEWARALLNRPIPEGARVFQLGQRCIEELKARAGQPGLHTPAELAKALDLLDQGLAGMGALGSLLPRQRLRLGQACDLAALQFELVDPGWRGAYQVDGQGQWQWQAQDLSAAGLGVNELQPLPEQLFLLSHPAGQNGQATLRLRSRMMACCDLQTHPQLVLNNSQGRRDWRGQRVAEWRHTFASEPAPEGMAVEGTPVLSELQLESCGLRDSGAAVGSPRTRLAVYPAEQHLMVWRREPGAPLALPGDTAAAPTPRLRLLRDEVTQPTGRQQEQLAALDDQLLQGLQALRRHWERHGMEEAQLSAEPAVLAGTAGLAWGWVEGAQALSDPPWMRVAAAIDLVVWQLNLQLSGRLQVAGTQTLVRLQCQGTERLQRQWQRTVSDIDLTTAIAPLQLGFRQPLTLTLQPLALGQAALLHSAAPMQAAIVGRAGLRQRTDGPGLQWFVQAAIEAVRLEVGLLDPVMGLQTLGVDLLPPAPLLDWSMA